MNYVLAFQLSAPADETCKMQTSFFITHTQEFRGALLAITFLGEVNTLLISAHKLSEIISSSEIYTCLLSPRSGTRRKISQPI